MRGHRQEVGAALVAVTALAAGLRFATLDVQSFWADEGFTVEIARTPLAHLLHAVSRTESTPPVYYALAWLWGKVFGTGEVGLRSLSALLGTGTVPLVYLAGRLAVSRRAGLFAAALTAVSPLLVWYSQEARAYALLVFLSALGLVLFLQALERPRRRTLLAWGVVSSLAIGTHYFAAFTVAAELAWLFVALPTTRRQLFAAAALPAAAVAALAPLVIYQRDHVPRPWTSTFGVTDQVAAIYQEFLVGHTWTWLIHRPGVAALSLLLGAGVLLAWRRNEGAERRGAALFAGLAAVTVAIPLALALVGSNYLAPRNVLVALPLVLLVAAAGLAATRTGRIGATGLAAACTISLAIVVAVDSTSRLQRDDWRGVAEATREHSGGRIVVAVDRFTNGRVAKLYFGGGQVEPSSPVVSQVLLVSRTKARDLNLPLLLHLPKAFSRIGRLHVKGGLAYLSVDAPAPTRVSLAALRRSDATVIYEPSVQSGGS